MTPPYILAFMPQLEIFEGRERSFYLDTGDPANVTIGDGFMVPTALAACGLPMCLPDGVTPATAAQIAVAYDRVKAMPPGRPAAFYAYAGAPVMPDAEIDKMLLSELLELDAQLSAHFIGWDDHLPDSVKMACLDQGWNLGVHGFIDGYPKECAAIERGDWATAAAECHRNGISDARNNWTREQFLSIGAIM
jgi:hypothetical protein